MDNDEKVESELINENNNITNFTKNTDLKIINESGDCLDSFLEDIEDIHLLTDLDTSNERRNKDHVLARVKRKKTMKTDLKNEIVETENLIVSCDSIIPGTQKIYLKTWGCSHNNSDSEYMAGQLASYGYKIIDYKESADLWLLNSCTVKNPSEDHFRNEIALAKKLNKYVVLAGCVPQGQPKSDYISGLSVIGVQQIDRVIEVVEETLKGHSVRLLGKKKMEGRKVGGASLSLPKVRKNPLIEIIAINTGCLNQCTYCKTKHARGELGSYSPAEIVARVVQSFQEGVVEIWLTSEDLGAYGHDIGVTLPDLLWQIVKVVPKGAMIRLGMTNPPYILEHLEEIAKILNVECVYSFLHIPVQSGSDHVLTTMKREYCQADFRRVVDYLKQKVEDITIATDIICGFPGETEQDLEDTMNLIRDYRFPSLFINQFFPRQGTPAAKMEKIPTNEVKKRTKLVSDLFNSYQTYNKKIGKIIEVLVTELSTDEKFYVGHDKNYSQVLVPIEGDWMGKRLTVKIIGAGKHYLNCNVIKVSNVALSLTLNKGQVSGALVEMKKQLENTGIYLRIENLLSQLSPWIKYSLIAGFGVVLTQIGLKLGEINRK